MIRVPFLDNFQIARGLIVVEHNQYGSPVNNHTVKNKIKLNGQDSASFSFRVNLDLMTMVRLRVCDQKYEVHNYTTTVE